MIYGSVCSGIEAATVAWHPLGWTPKFFSEIEKFPSAVLAHHYGSNMPDEPLTENGIPNYGDFTEITADAGPVDLLVGGTPCQDLSNGYAAGAGEAGDGFDGDRSGLAFEFAALGDRLSVDWFVWENVANVLTGRFAEGFLRFCKTLAEIGFGIAWRVIDARNYGLSDQPRPRLFMVGYRGDARSAAAVLFERSGDCRDKQTKTPAAPVLTARGGNGSR